MVGVEELFLLSCERRERIHTRNYKTLSINYSNPTRNNFMTSHYVNRSVVTHVIGKRYSFSLFVMESYETIKLSYLNSKFVL